MKIWASFVTVGLDGFDGGTSMERVLGLTSSMTKLGPVTAINIKQIMS
jgi:hypothetical protein